MDKAPDVLPLTTVAISPCPNDTFIFGSWILGQCKSWLSGRAAFVWADVQELNESAKYGRYDVVKVSAAQALNLRDQYTILGAGGAFGCEHGPKLVRATNCTSPRSIAVPGMQTTAVTLLKRAWPEPAELVPVRYDRIVELVCRGRVDAGLLIHESALLLHEYGLECLLDLGQWWRDRTGGLPLPLGCIIARKSLGQNVLQSVERQIQASLDQAHCSSQSVWPLVQAMAQEMDNAVLRAHIQAYVNAFSRNMGQEGQEALVALEHIVRLTVC
jgi:1,4-dihydroxy-6-naphthoate synthase